MITSVKILFLNISEVLIDVTLLDVESFDDSFTFQTFLGLEGCLSTTLSLVIDDLVGSTLLIFLAGEGEREPLTEEFLILELLGTPFPDRFLASNGQSFIK
jgi:hypothetical protein